MKTSLPACLCAAILLGCASDDPITRLVAKCEADQHSGPGEVFPSGLFSPIELPASASIIDLVSQAIHDTNFNILATRKVKIADEWVTSLQYDFNYTAVMISTGSEKKIVLLRFQASSKGWWNRVFDAK
jgi:hypothetical protein